ncbi:MAG TPA: GxxExxY protein [Geothrix sp.]|uniref:GxxExxY protein n=1 Tax=Geothrix mesophila TaxID=2922723 RepID=UPI001FADA618|nr:GxxExxY protein [Geothrix sp. SG198]HJV39179.1 GxxExxY protein [Geothrix sp.]
MTPKETPAADLILPEESYALMGAAFEVYKELGPGFLEAVYEEALARELASRGIPFRRQVPLAIHYKGSPLDKHYVCDLVVFDQIIVELKAIQRITDIEMAQTLNYLKAAGYSLALILNFSATGKLEWKRIARTNA